MTSAKRAYILVGVLFLLGAAGSVWCFEHHICMDGHLAHPDQPHGKGFSVVDYVGDMAWAGSLCFACGISFAARLRIRWLAVIIPVFLFYRFALGSMGGPFRFPI